MYDKVKDWFDPEFEKEFTEVVRKVKSLQKEMDAVVRVKQNVFNKNRRFIYWNKCDDATIISIALMEPYQETFVGGATRLQTQMDHLKEFCEKHKPHLLNRVININKVKVLK
jgi:hypothetical protein